MPRAVPRKFQLLDAIVLVASTALALAWLRWKMDQPSYEFHAYTPDWSAVPGSFHEDVLIVRRAAYLSDPFAILFGVTILALGFRGPRPPFRRWIGRPGSSACLAASLGFLAVVAELAITAAHEEVHPQTGGFFGMRIEPRLIHCVFDGLGVLPQVKGVAVLATWSSLALTGRWRRCCEWLDRAGVAVGVYWILAMIIAWFDRIPD